MILKLIEGLVFHYYFILVLDRDEANYTTDLAEQCHRNAQIASAKFIALRVSMLSLFIAIVPWLVLIWRLYQIKK